MVPRRVVAALVLAQLIALAALAQSAEFGRASGGEIAVVPKGTAALSGSLGISAGSGNDLFAGGKGDDATLGGTLIQDRLWFFAAGSQQSGSRFGTLALPERAVSRSVDAKLQGRIGDRQSFSAIFDAARMPAVTAAAPNTFTGIAPSSFLSLRYTGILSSNSFFNASFTRSAATRRDFGLLPTP
jgi:hypothetical protein